MTPPSGTAPDSTQGLDGVLRFLLAPTPSSTVPPDGDRLYEVARRSGLECILRERGGHAPEPLRHTWERAWRQTEAGNLLRLQALDELSPAFEDAGAAMVSLENSSDVPVLMGFIEVLDEDISLAEIEEVDMSVEPEWLGTWTMLREVPPGESLEYETILPSGIYTFWVLDETTGEISLSGRIDTR